MTQHACWRCGQEWECRRWWDRHPVCAVLFALPAGYTLIGVVLAYPWFFVPLLIVVLAWWVDRRNRRRAAVAARADHEHRELMVRAVADAARRERSWACDIPSKPFRANVTPCAPTLRAPRHVLTDWPTTPMLTKPIRRNR